MVPVYEDMTNDELSAELESRGLPKSGNKSELIARLEEHDAAKAAEDEAGDTGPAADENPPADSGAGPDEENPSADEEDEPEPPRSERAEQVLTAFDPKGATVSVAPEGFEHSAFSPESVRHIP